ncbi:MAG: terpene cyclase/mutase family protein [Eubacteriales bacterium]|nr:terpene cyclase/mutase family protein [Eubacteriales bacterium]
MIMTVFAANTVSGWEIVTDRGQNKAENKAYYSTVADTLKKNDGVLDKRKYTEYSKTIIALTAAGYDPANVKGYNLLNRLTEKEMVVKQGINGPIWALIALDSGSYPSDLRDYYISYILERELSAGGWNMEGKGTADPDVTAMALQALSGYQDRANVKAAVERAVSELSRLQDSDGGYSSWGTPNAESASQVVIALTCLDIDINDKRFVKNGKTIINNLETYRLSDGTYMHSKANGTSDSLATEQAGMAFAAVARQKEGKKLYKFR